MITEFKGYLKYTWKIWMLALVFWTAMFSVSVSIPSLPSMELILQGFICSIISILIMVPVNFLIFR